jgi:hypothetical protein
MFSFKKSLTVFPGLLVIIAVFSALVPLVSRGQGGGGNPFNRDSRTSFYLTKTTHDGSQALTACTAGYHMASLYEVLDPSNLSYETQLGFSHDDSGVGPATGVRGWIRTGNPARTDDSLGGNCNAWTSANNADGTFVFLAFEEESLVVVSPWRAATAPCFISFQVWCVQD